MYKGGLLRFRDFENSATNLDVADIKVRTFNPPHSWLFFFTCPSVKGKSQTNSQINTEKLDPDKNLSKPKLLAVSFSIDSCW